ncbi:SPOR and LysM peptidoglycan-binding domain-containing protein [Moraxella sp. Pampa]|uniref:SPOR and LysM peptidoglycan-binding domain-containing protein n=1 Tax=Moraxella sp. Pampa TaxID=3111978 RepID=UPI002B40625A|nr:LysM peptidoglycan-binding domain-containing protein [Moraxella sp. Pampa]
MISKQVILGSVLLIGGAVTIFAMTQNNKPAQSSDTTLTQVVKDGGLVAKPETKPLTADVMTEEKLLIQKQKERELYNQQLAQEADELLKEQEQARMLALDKAKQEAGQIPSTHIGADSASKSELIAAPEVQIRPEAVKAISTQKNALEDKLNQQKPLTEKKSKETAGEVEAGLGAKLQSEPTSPTQPKVETKTVPAKDKHTVVRGDTLIGLSRKYDVPVSVLATVNGMNRNDALPLGRTITIPSSAQLAKIDRDNQQKQTSDAQATTTKTKGEQVSVNSSSGYSYSVQVAISPDKAKVDEMVEKYRAAGYQVSVSQTSRGMRVLVGSADSYDAANELKQKLAKDSRVDAKGAWVKKLEK